jgi:hypothetical protein
MPESRSVKDAEKEHRKLLNRIIEEEDKSNMKKHIVRFTLFLLFLLMLGNLELCIFSSMHFSVLKSTLEIIFPGVNLVFMFYAAFKLGIIPPEEFDAPFNTWSWFK